MSRTPLSRRVSNALRSLAAVALLAQVAVGAVGAETLSAAPSAAAPSAAAAVPGRSTPDLIDAAVAAGEITREQRLLYLAYALYEQASLPARFVGSAGWDGTHVMSELRAAADGSTPSTWRPSAAVSAQSRNEIRRVSQQAAGGVCDKQDPANERVTDHFLIRYGDIGGGLTIQDYVDALETSYQVQNITFKWAKPPFGPKNATGKIPVLVSPDVGAGTYGYVTYGSSAPLTGVVGDNPNTPAVETAAIASCTALSADFSKFADPKWGSTARSALQATASHEYWHIISFGYGDPSPDESNAWFESVPPYIEFETFPNITDSYSYLWPRFTASLADYPIGQNPGPSQYSNWLLYRYAAERNGGMSTGGGGSALVTAWMENLAAGQRAIPAYDNALKTKSSSLAEVFHNYANAVRFPKACPDSAPYCFQDAANIVKFGANVPEAAPKNQASIDAVGGSATGQVKNNFAINWVGLPTSGAYAVTLTNTGDSGTLRASVVADMGATVQVIQMPVTLASKATTQLDYTAPAGATAISLTITNEQMTAEPEQVAATGYEVRTAARSGAAAPGPAVSSGLRSYVGHLAKNARGVPGAAATANSLTTLELRNEGSAAATATITFYGADGARALTTSPTYPVAAGSETEVSLVEIANLVDGVYSAVVDSTQPLDVVALTGATKRVVGNLEEAVAPGLGDADAARKAFVPGIYRRYFGYTTSVTVQNTSATASANATVSFYDPSGKRVDAATRHIAPGASQSIDVEYSSLPVGFRGGAVVTADQNVAVTYSTFDEYGTVAVAAAPLVGATVAYVPAAYSRYYGFDTSLVIQSTGSTSPALTISYSNGTTQNLTVPASGTTELFLPGQGLPGGFNGAATIRSTNGGEFIARVNVGNLESDSLNVYDAPTGGATTVELPNVEKLHGPQKFVSSIALQNVGNAATDVSIRFDDGTTHRVGTLQPGAGSLVYVPNISALADGYRGGATITTTGQPVLAIVSTNGTVSVVPGGSEGHNP